MLSFRVKVLYLDKQQSQPLKPENCEGWHPLWSENIMTENKCDKVVQITEHPFIDLRESSSPEILRVIAISSPQVVQLFVVTLFRYGYARPDEWSRQFPTINPGEVMRILTKRISLID